MPFGRQGRPGLLGAVAPTADPSATEQGRTAATRSRALDRSREPARAPGPPQLADQLARLAQLHSSGVLTPEEFAAAKSRLLA